MIAKRKDFKKAVAVWAEGEECSLNYRLALKERLVLCGGVLKIAAYTFYRLQINGKFVAFGPARCASGYARVDEISLTGFDGECDIEIFVAGYNNKGLSTAKQPSFVACEIENESGEVIAWTGKHFLGYADTRRVRKVERFSYQRHFSEVFDEREEVFCEKNKVKLVKQESAPCFIERVAPYPEFFKITDLFETDRVGEFCYDESLPCKNQRYSSPISEEWGKFDENEIEYLPYRWVQKQKMTNTGGAKRLPITLREGEYAVFDFGAINVGFLRYLYRATEESEITLAFSEMRLEGEFHFQNANMHTVIHSIAPKGYYGLTESFEPYSCRFLAVLVKRGAIELEWVGVRAYEHNKRVKVKHEFKNPVLKKIFDAGVNTFVHNAVDLYSDCPSRERAGWLCDTYFTAKSEWFLFGESRVESAFLQNYLLYQPNGEYPDGVLPMCYPSDRQEGRSFIPQWNMWLVLEVGEYLTQRDAIFTKEEFRPKIFAFMEFLQSHENELGLLERLPGWNFVEWSDANEWTQDVNYPTNFLYAQVLRVAGALYERADWLEKAERVSETTRRMAFDGEVFVDHAVRDENGELKNLSDTSEACQYYAMLFSVVKPDNPQYEKLFKRVFGKDFGSLDNRRFVRVNAFIGLYLRLLVIDRFARYDGLKNDIIGFFGGMEELTGTLWEYKQHKGSYDHGFASLAAVFAVTADKN